MKKDNINSLKNKKCLVIGRGKTGISVVKLFNQQIENSFRFVNDNDPVPCIPTAWRFKHVKGIKWINKDKIVHEIRVWRFYRFVKNLFLSFFSLGGYNSLNDHSCDEYIKDLEIVF